MKKVILFGGTFDPIHQGHIKIALAAKKQIQADEVIFILSKNPRWKTPTVNTIDRLNMLKIAIKDYEGFSYSTFEIDNDSDFDYSIDTARHFVEKSKKNNEDIKYYWLIGSDQVAQLDRWAQIDELASLVQFVYYNRETDKDNKENIKKYNVLKIDGEKINISSTSVRRIENCELDDKVFDYMCDHGLYYLKDLKNLLSPKRFAHSVSVARLSRDIAKANHKNYNLAFYAGLFHDVGKNVDDDKSYELLKKYYSDFIDMPKWSWHQFIGVIVARDQFNIEDNEILESICFHATGRSSMSPLGKIIYSADKIDPLRGYDSSSLIKSCMRNYAEGFVEVLKANKEYLEENNKLEKNRLTEDCYKYYIKG